MTDIADIETDAVPGRREERKAQNRAKLLAAARKVFAEKGVGAATARDIVRLLGLTADRIDVVPMGPGSGAPVRAVDDRLLRQRHGLGEGPVVLTVSAKWPHKNLSRLIEALAQRPTEQLLVVHDQYGGFRHGALL